MGKTQWASRQFSRYDLTVTKMQKLLGLITASGMVATAIALGASLILILLLLFGFGTIMTLAYILDKVGFQKATAEELWMLCDRLGVDFDAVRDAANTLDSNPPIMEARDGIGDACLPMAIEYIASINAVAIGVSDASMWTDAAYRLKRGR